MDSTNFTPPARRSMTDSEIQDALGNAQADEAGIMAAMELLETQAQLRDIEKMEFSAWVIEMERIGTPEAMLAVENANRAKQGLEPLTSPTIAPPVVEPIEDVVSRLNSLYAAQSAQPAAPAEPVEQDQPESETQPVEQVLPEPMAFEVADVVEVAEHFQVAEVVAVPDLIQEPEVDEFERLLAADTVVGAEDELTALEEELAEHVYVPPVAAVAAVAEESLLVVEADPGVQFESSSPVEDLKLESLPKVSRRSNAFSQFWAWLGLSGSVLPLGLAWYVHSIGISYTQALLAIFLGALASAIVISVGALAGKRSGLPTVMLSRAPFGVFGNAAPASVLTLVRILWSASILAVLISFGAEFFAVKSITDLASTQTLTLAAVSIVAVAGAVTLAIFGGRFLFKAQQVAGLIGSAAVLTLIAVTFGTINTDALLAQATSGWLNVFGIAVLTFSIFGLAWTSAGADFARKLSTSARGASVVGWGALALAIIPTVVAGYGLALIGSIPKAETDSLTSPGFYQVTMLETFSAVITPWLGFVLVGSAAISLVVILAMSLYSSNLSLHSIGAKLRPALAQPVLGVVALVIAAAGVVYLSNIWQIIADYALIAAVPVAAWSGIFVSDILIRRIAYHEISLSRSYGFYKSVNWVNLSAWVIATALGYGLIYSTQPGFNWTGFIADAMVNQQFWATTSFGIIIAFAFGSLTPLAAGIPRIKRQESEVLAIEARRDDLKDIFGLAD